MDKAKKLELFGSDSEDEDEDETPPAVQDETPPADDEEEDLGDDNLFGSEDEAEPVEQPAQANSGVAVQYSLPSMPRPASDAKVRATFSHLTREVPAAHARVWSHGAQALTRLHLLPAHAAFHGEASQHPPVPAPPIRPRDLRG